MVKVCRKLLRKVGVSSMYVYRPPLVVRSFERVIKTTVSVFWLYNGQFLIWIKQMNLSEQI